MRHSAPALVLGALALLACGEDGGGGPLGPICETDADCDDGVFCNGIEVCAPGNDEATAFGCVAAAAAPCLDGQVCDEEMDRCTTRCELGVDADGDGVDAMECGGEDCDDADANRFPGNAEVCDAEAHDEDCDPATVGFDLDGDGFVGDRCCNEVDGERTCGMDCDDLSRGSFPGRPTAATARTTTATHGSTRASSVSATLASTRASASAAVRVTSAVERTRPAPSA